jgi:glycosyltransferase involved in cell wall biosynthesis
MRILNSPTFPIANLPDPETSVSETLVVRPAAPVPIDASTRARISAIVLTFNEAKRLAPCLESLLWADEIIVVDGFSTDDTVAIARGYTSLVYRSDLLGPGKPGGFSDQRNFAMAQATGDWILFIDADERVTPELAGEIRSTANRSQDGDPVGFRMRRREYLFGVPTHYTHGPSWQTRMVRRDAGHWNGRAVHEGLHIEGQVGDLEGMLLHYSKDSIAHYVETMNRYTSLEAAESFKRNQMPERWPVAAIIKSFLHRYVYLESYREGVFGLLMSLMFACYTYLTWAKHWELAKNAGIIPGRTRPGRYTRMMAGAMRRAWQAVGSIKRRLSPPGGN